MHMNVSKAIFMYANILNNSIASKYQVFAYICAKKKNIRKKDFQSTKNFNISFFFGSNLKKKLVMVKNATLTFSESNDQNMMVIVKGKTANIMQTFNIHLLCTPMHAFIIHRSISITNC